jgi:hypothetical protein
VICDNGASTGASPLPIFVLNGKWNVLTIIFMISPVGAMPPCSPLLCEPQIIFDRKIPDFHWWIFEKKLDRLTAKRLIKEGQINTKKGKGLR